MKIASKAVAILATSIVSCVSVGMSLGMSTSAYAADVREKCSHGKQTYYDHKMVGGIGKYGATPRNYWINSDLESKWVNNRIPDAVDKWNHTSSGVNVKTSILLKKTTTKSAAMFEFHKVTWKPSNGRTVYGRTNYYYQQKEVTDPSRGDWTWAKISLNTKYLSDDLSNAQEEATVEHELGHAFGLSHQHSTPSSIMAQVGDGRTAKRASANDAKLINHIYD